MWIGLGIILIVIGAVLNWALNTDVPLIDDGILGWILIGAGVAAIIFSFIAQAQRNRVHTTTESRHIDTRVDPH